MQQQDAALATLLELAHRKFGDLVWRDVARREIDDGIASVSVALGDPKDLAPYF